MYWAKLMIENKMALSNIQETSSTTRNDASEIPAALHTSTRYIPRDDFGCFLRGPTAHDCERRFQSTLHPPHEIMLRILTLYDVI